LVLAVHHQHDKSGSNSVFASITATGGGGAVAQVGQLTAALVVAQGFQWNARFWYC
jgi:hypothetical protein